MITVRLVGGLGNQMFQYALGRSLSIRTGQSLRLDPHTPDPNPHARFELDHFQIVGSLTSLAEHRLVWQPLVKAADLWGQDLPGLRCERVIGFQPEALEHRGSVYLAGYWQSERYFVDVASILRRDFALKSPPAAVDSDLLQEMEAEESVCVHVRRGDYVVHAATAATHGVCGADYYEAARKLMSSRLAAPRFYVFSDDHAWAKSAMGHWPSTMVIDHHPTTARLEDFRLMAGCRHFVIANSSFSWWPAWLAEKPGQIVVAPKRWFADTTLDGSQIVPERWERL